MASMTWTTAGDRRYGERGAHAPGSERVAQVAARLESGRGAPRIWAVGGGKGGVGKSVISSNLAAAMAGAGRRCAVIDADLGGANLHTLLGVSRPRAFAVASADRRRVFAGGPDGPDLGSQPLARERQSGAARDGQSDAQPEGDAAFARSAASTSTTSCSISARAARSTSSISSCWHGADSSSSRPSPRRSRTQSTSSGSPSTARCARSRGAPTWPRRSGGCARTAGRDALHSAGELIALVRAIDPPAAKLLEERAQAFAPLLIVNQVQTAEHRGVGPRLVATCRERLGAAIEFAGSHRRRPERRGGGGAAAAGAPGLPALPLLPAHRGARGAPPASGSRAPARARGGERSRFLGAAAPGRHPRTRRLAVPRRCPRSIGPSPAPTCAGVARRWASASPR